MKCVDNRIIKNYTTVERENFKAHLIKVDLHPQISSPIENIFVEKDMEFFKRKDK